MATKKPAKKVTKVAKKATKKAVKKAATKPLSDRAWKKLTARQQKATDAKRYERDKKAADKAAEKAKKEAAKLKELDKKYVYTSAKTGRKVTAKFALANPDTTIRQPRKKPGSKTTAKKVTKAAKPVAKKTPVRKTKPKTEAQFDASVLPIGADPGIEVGATQHGTGEVKVTDESELVQNSGRDGGRITEIRKVSGLDGRAHTYTIIAEKPKGNTEAQIGVRFIGGDFRIHAFPDFKTHGITDHHYTSGTIRKPTGDRGQYQTRWVNKNEFLGFMNKLRESALHAHLSDELLSQVFKVEVGGEAAQATV